MNVREKYGKFSLYVVILPKNTNRPATKTIHFPILHENCRQQIAQIVLLSRIVNILFECGKMVFLSIQCLLPSAAMAFAGLFNPKIVQWRKNRIMKMPQRHLEMEKETRTNLFRETWIILIFDYVFNRKHKTSISSFCCMTLENVNIHGCFDSNYNSAYSLSFSDWKKKQQFALFTGSWNGQVLQCFTGYLFLIIFFWCAH